MLVSGILFEGRARNALRALLRGEFRLVTSEHLLDELDEVLVSRFSFTTAAAAQVRAELGALAQVVDPAEVPRICRDPDDDQVLAAAVIGLAEAIVTGDEDLLSLNQYAGVTIVRLADLVLE